MMVPIFTTMAAWAAACVLNALWQVALVFCAAWIAARVVRTAGPQAEHRVWVGAVLLASVLPFCRLHPELWLHRLLALLEGSGNGSVAVQVTQTAVLLTTKPWLPAWAQSALALLFLLAFVFAALRLAWNLWLTRELLIKGTPMEPAGAMAELLQSYTSALGVEADSVRLLCLDELHGPATVGLVRHSLLLPADLLELSAAESTLTVEQRDELATTLAHELVHIRRADYAWNLLYELASLPFVWHPLLLLARAQLRETRELASDAEAAQLLDDQRTYARSLVRMAARMAVRPVPRPLHAVGIYDTNIFERRIMHLMRKTESISLVRRVAAGAACVLIALATCYTAMALQANVTPAPADAPKHVMVSSGVAVRNLLSKVAPVYPPDAKKAGIQGTVVLDAVIGKDGHISSLKVLSGPEELAASAKDAVQQWVYTPYLFNGNPVEMQTTINVIYTLGDHAPAAAPAPAAVPAPAAAPAPAAIAAPTAPVAVGFQSPPTALEAINAAYPPEAKAAHQEGIVVVTAKIGVDGRATVLATKGPDAFLKNAREAVERVGFKPATRDGQPVEATVTIEVNFKLY